MDTVRCPLEPVDSVDKFLNTFSLQPTLPADISSSPYLPRLDPFQSLLDLPLGLEFPLIRGKETTPVPVNTRLNRRVVDKLV